MIPFIFRTNLRHGVHVVFCQPFHPLLLLGSFRQLKNAASFETIVAPLIGLGGGNNLPTSPINHNSSPPMDSKLIRG